jgi:hypothetical protein
MCRTSILAVALVAGLLSVGAALANPANPAPTPNGQAMTEILQSLSGPPAGAQFVFVNHCEPPTRFPCVNKQCQCGVTCGSAGIKSFTCDPTTFVSKCVCN